MARLSHSQQMLRDHAKRDVRDNINPIKSKLLNEYNRLVQAPACITLANELDGIIARLEAFQQKL